MFFSVRHARWNKLQGTYWWIVTGRSNPLFTAPRNREIHTRYNTRIKYLQRHDRVAILLFYHSFHFSFVAPSCSSREIFLWRWHVNRSRSAKPDRNIIDLNFRRNAFNTDLRCELLHALWWTFPAPRTTQ